MKRFYRRQRWRRKHLTFYPNKRPEKPENPLQLCPCEGCVKRRKKRKVGEFREGFLARKHSKPRVFNDILETKMIQKFKEKGWD